jgi:hypothetical protein
MDVKLSSDPGFLSPTPARECARTIAGWKPLPAAACRITPLRLRRSRARPTKPLIDLTRARRFARQDGQHALVDDARFAQTHGRPSRWPPMTEDGKPLETMLEDAARARRLAIVLEGDPAALELEQYAEEVEAEILRRTAADRVQ